MNISYRDDEIIFRVDSGSTSASLERSYLKRFDGATVRFVSNEEGDRLVIDRSPQTPGGNYERENVAETSRLEHEIERLQRENEKLSATIDNVRVAMRKRGSVVAIQAVNQTIYEHDHSEEDAQCDHDEKLAVDSVSLDEIISVVHGWNRDARGYPDVAMEKIAKIIEERGD